MNTDRYEKSQRAILWVTYILHILLFPAALGAIINAVKIREYRKPAMAEDKEHQESNNVLMSHHQWLLRTFLISLFFMAMGYGTMYYGVGYILGIGAVVWWIYRMIRGLIGCAEKRPMPVA